LPGVGASHAQALARAMATVTITRVAMGAKPAPARKKDAERSDQSRKNEARVQYPASNARAMLGLASEIAGRPVVPEDFVELAGAPGGSTVKVESDRESRLIISVKARAYSFVGQLIRRPDESLVLKLDSVTVARSRRRQGMGREAFARQLEEARKLGVDRIELLAARNDDPRFLQVGYKVWPKFGFDADLDPPRAAGLPKGLRRARRLSDLLAEPGGRDWWEKHGWSIRLEFDMTAGSRSWQAWRHYVQRKQAGR